MFVIELIYKADLPAIDLYALPDAALRRGRPGYAQLPWWPPPGKGREH